YSYFLYRYFIKYLPSICLSLIEVFFQLLDFHTPQQRQKNQLLNDFDTHLHGNVLCFLPV
ncbi:MAG: hypothetical protein RLZ09_1879, partial [Pseudomonadota bacterium]